MKFSIKPAVLSLVCLVGCSSEPTKENPELSDLTVQPEQEEDLETEPSTTEPTLDEDEDGFGTDEDCDDTDPTINPDATDYTGDNIDQDCDGQDEPGICNDTCTFSGDGECDDGGYGSTYDVCDFGTDCTDCGPRRDQDNDNYYDAYDCDDTDPAINPSALDFTGDGIDQDCDGQDFSGLCFDTCTYAGDGQCDDGGTDSEYSLCDLGSDCSDCGQRIDADNDGWDSLSDCDDLTATIHPGIQDNTCNGIDENCDGNIDESWPGDQYEPNDQQPYNLGELYENATLAINGYVSHGGDVDSYTFYCEDDWGNDFGFFAVITEISGNIDISAELYYTDRTGNSIVLATSDNLGFGGTESLSYQVDDFDDQSGWYTITVRSKSGSDCSTPYKLTLTED